jgi:hypothetical protein
MLTPNALSLSTVYKHQRAWYRGDLHAHTTHSDGTHPPPDLAALARHEGLDFFAITDHNATSAYTEFGAEPGVLIIPGIEVTFRAGHYSVFGVASDETWLAQVQALKDYRAEFGGGESFGSINALLAETRRLGLLNSINHPLLKPWAWEFAHIDLGLIDCIEIWNDPSWPDNMAENPRAVALWTAALNAGHRIAAIGGSDYHRPEPESGHQKPPERLGVPSTYVLAEELSGKAILDAVRRRRAYVSMGPTVAFNGFWGDESLEIGDEHAGYRGGLTLCATVGACDVPGKARIVRDGSPIAEQSIGARETVVACRAEIDTAQSTWIRLDVTTEDGSLLAMTNPIFIGPRQIPKSRTFEEVAETISR